MPRQPKKVRRRPGRDTPFIPPSLPVTNSVFHQLGILESHLPLAIIKLADNLLLFPSPERSNICTNSGLSDKSRFRRLVAWDQTNDIGTPPAGKFWDEGAQRLALHKRLNKTIAKGRSGPDGDKDYHKSREEMLKSMPYLNQIAIVCLASGLLACQSPDCLQYRTKLERVVPVCDSWPGLRDWVLSIMSCSLRAMKDRYGSKDSKYGFDSGSRGWDTPVLLRCLVHMTTCIRLTMSNTELAELLGYGLPETTLEPEDKNDLKDGISRVTIYSVERIFVSS